MKILGEELGGNGAVCNCPYRADSGVVASSSAFFCLAAAASIAAQYGPTSALHRAAAEGTGPQRVLAGPMGPTPNLRSELT